MTITAALISGPHGMAEWPDHKIEMRVVLDRHGRLDMHAWEADPEAWVARRLRPDAPSVRGDVQYDPDEGWVLRFYQGHDQSPDAPRCVLGIGVGPLRPGHCISVIEPGWKHYGYRIVGVG
ncbi:MAG TPA: hypothetical protein VD970_16355 [Acetobacteraceae bacterium]|nr:hypothetical protein [Acetobacteraceae bacterium]